MEHEPYLTPGELHENYLSSCEHAQSKQVDDMKMSNSKTPPNHRHADESMADYGLWVSAQMLQVEAALLTTPSALVTSVSVMKYLAKTREEG